MTIRFEEAGSARNLVRPTIGGPAAQTQNARLTALLHVGFVLTGVVTTMLGPLLPTLSARWALSDARAGYLFTAQFSGSMVGVMASSVLMSHRAHRAALIVGLGLMALGSAALMAASWEVGMVATFGFGVGLGFAIPTTNLLVSELNPGKRAASVSLINVSWGLGAAACPVCVAAFLRVHRGTHFLYGLAALLLLAALGFQSTSFPHIHQVAEKIAGFHSRLWRSRWIPILGALFFLYVGSEAGVGGWTATYARRMAAGTGTLWILMPSFFWAALLLGRAIAPLLLRSVRETALAQFGLAMAALGLLALLSAKNLFVIAAAVSLAGLGLAPIFPIAIAMLSRKFGAESGRIAGFMFALSGLGGAILPWLIGFTSTTTGNLKYGLLVPLVGCIVMSALNVPLAQSESHPTPNDL